MADKVVTMSLLVAKSTEVGKLRATKVIFFLKECLVILKTQKYFDYIYQF